MQNPDALFDNFPPLKGENFRAFLCRRVAANSTLSREARRSVQQILLRHFRASGLDVNALATDCVTAINLYRAGVQ